MHYVIDGYNLLHHVGRLQTGRTAHLESARLDLLRWLQVRFKTGPDRATVVFDAKSAPPGVPEVQDHFGIEVCFPRGREADDLIEDLIRTDAPRGLIVVSNDRRIKKAAQRRGCGLVECVEFWETLGEQRPPVADSSPDDGRLTPPLGDVEEWLRAFGEGE